LGCKKKKKKKVARGYVFLCFFRNANQKKNALSGSGVQSKAKGERSATPKKIGKFAKLVRGN
jgi:hypothetical protein